MIEYLSNKKWRLPVLKKMWHIYTSIFKKKKIGLFIFVFLTLCFQVPKNLAPLQKEAISNASNHKFIAHVSLKERISNELELDKPKQAQLLGVNLTTSTITWIGDYMNIFFSELLDWNKQNKVEPVSAIIDFKASVSGPNPIATAFAFQPSCIDNIVQSDGYLQISEVTDGDRYHFSMGNTFDDNGGANTYANATSFTTFPEKTTANLANPTGSQDYTIRVYNADNACFTDVTVTMQEQDCTISCNCTEFIYLNETTNGGSVHKYSIDPSDGDITEISTNGNPWYPSSGVSELPNPHGLGTDLNGFVYIGETGDSGHEIRRLTCNGEIIPESTFAITTEGQTNVVSNGNFLYHNDWRNTDGAEVAQVDICTGNEVGAVEFENITDNRTSWGLYFDKRTETFYSTTTLRSNGAPYNVWIYTEADFDTDPLTTISPAFSLDAQLGTFINRARVGGIVTDENGNIYIVVQNDGSTNVNSHRNSKILKYGPGPTYTFLGESAVDNNPNGTGYHSAIGIIYSEISGLLYVSTTSAVDDCVALFNTDLDYLKAGVPSPGDGTSAKGISILRECCPVNNNITLDTAFCETSINDVIFLQELINCNGIICEGIWDEETSNTGLSYNSCNNSVTVNALNACGSFTLSSDGTGNNSQCGAFTITVNITVANVTSSLVAGDQSVCAGQTPAAFTVTTPASGSATIAYQWQNSTTDCTTGFVDIIGANSATYNPPVITQTTYYRVISSVDGGCSTDACRDTSNCVTITLNTSPILDITSSNPSCGNSDGSMVLTLTNVPNGNYIIDYMDDVPSAQTFTNVSVAGGMATITGLSQGTYNDLSITVAGCTSAENIDILLAEDCFSLGNQVFLDSDNSGHLNGSEMGIDNVQLQLLNSTGAVYDSDLVTAGIQALTVTTANGGYYRFDDLPAGDYIVEVIASNFSASNSLENFTSSTGANQEATPNANGDSNDNGLDVSISGAIRSGTITLGDTEPTGETEPGSYGVGATTGAAATDENSNLTVDFGFITLCPTIDSLISDRVICSSDLVDSLAVTTTSTNPDSIAFVYFTSPQTDSMQIYTSGIGLDTAQITSGNDTVTVMNVAFPANTGSSPVTYYVYGIAHPIPTTLTCRPYDEIRVTVHPNPVLMGIDTAICGTQTINLATLISGPTTGTVTYGTSFGTYPTAITTDATVSSTTTYYVRDSNTTTMCIDTTTITIIVNSCDWGDLPDLTVDSLMGDYQTLSANGGPVHIIDTDLTLGVAIDGENDGQPSTDANGDDIDEDGLTIFSSLDVNPGNMIRLPLSATNNTGSTAYIEAWIDWNGDGDFSDAGEMVMSVDDTSGFPDRLETIVPTDAITGSLLGVRIRIGNQSGMTPYGLQPIGEVEDYLLMVGCPQNVCLPIAIEIKKE